MNVVTRFPPSPTGFFHIGSARTALFNHLFAAHVSGKMILRFEDTDTARNKKEYEDDILAGLEWLGIPYQMPDVFRQSERTALYRKYIQHLLESGYAYEAEAATDDATKKVIRFKNSGTDITFSDLIRGEVNFNTADLKDFVIARSIDEPLYHLTVVVDDHEMGVTHVIRGEDHISNTPRQILILEALGFTRPIYGHIPLILAPDRSKMSKRHGAVSINEYRARGYLPEAIVNYLALLGWNPGTQQEMFSMSELEQTFAIERVQKSGAIFDIEKLRSLNRQYLSKMSIDDFASYALPVLQKCMTERQVSWNASIGEKLLPIIRERISVSKDILDIAGAGELDYFFTDPFPHPEKIPEKKSNPEEAKQHLGYTSQVLGSLETWNENSTKDALWKYATEHGRGAVLWPLRYALSGLEKSPDPFTIAALIGKESTLKRIGRAVATLEMV